MLIPLQKMNVGKDEMEEGEVSSSDGEDLGEYTPLQVGILQLHILIIVLCRELSVVSHESEF